MSLDDLLWRRLRFQNVILKCLSIECVEYCYFIPIVSQLVDYWGDIKLACLCKIMSRQVKQHLNHAIHIHLLFSTPSRDPETKGSQKKGEQGQRFFQRDLRKSGPSTQLYQLKEFIGQKNLGPKKQKGLKIENIDTQEFVSPLKLWLTDPLGENFQFLHQNTKTSSLLSRGGSSQRPLVERIQSHKVRVFTQEKNELLIEDLREKSIISNLYNLDNSFFQLLKDTKVVHIGPEGPQFDINFFNDFFSGSKLPSYESSFSCLTSAQKTFYEDACGPIGKIESHMRLRRRVFTHQRTPFNHSEKKSQDVYIRNKIVDVLSRTYGKDISFLFFQILINRKIWKAEQWYPFVSTMSLNSQFFSHRVSSFFDSSSLLEIPIPSGSHIKRQRDFWQMEEQLSQSFLKLSQSEKQMSQLITTLINK